MIRVRDLQAMLADLCPDDEVVIRLRPEHILQSLRVHLDEDIDGDGLLGGGHHPSDDALWEFEVRERARWRWSAPPVSDVRIVSLEPTLDVSPSTVVEDEHRARKAFHEMHHRLAAERSAQQAVRQNREQFEAAVAKMQAR